QDFYHRLSGFKEHLRSKTRAVSRLYPLNCFDTVGFYCSLDDNVAGPISASCYYDVDLAQAKIRVEAKLSVATGWKICAWRLPDGSDLGKVSDWLAENGVPLLRQQNNEWISAEFEDFSADENQVRDEFQKLLYAIGTKLQKHELLKSLIMQ